MLLLILHSTCYTFYGNTKKTYSESNHHRHTTHNGSAYFTELKEKAKKEDAEQINNRGAVTQKQETPQQRIIPGIPKKATTITSCKK